MAKCYCKFCGRDFNSVSDLTARLCPRHPSGTNKGKHELYEGSEKDSYTCKYCGKTSFSISRLTEGLCPNHPNGRCKGNHSPAL